MLIYFSYSGRSRILGSHCLRKGRVSVDFTVFWPFKNIGLALLKPVQDAAGGGGGWGLSVVPLSIYSHE